MSGSQNTKKLQPIFPLKVTIILMKRNFIFFVLLYFQFDAAFAQVSNRTPQWNVAEINLISTKSYHNPFEDVEVNVTFSGPGNQNITRPAFWDGNRKWVVRFAPTAIGEWKMTTVCTDKANAGLGGIKKTIICEPYTGELEIYKHGFLHVSDNKRYFVYADGTPFFYLGDTHWIYIHERFASSNVSGVPSQFKYTVDKRVAQGFTVYQSEAIQQQHGQNSADGGGDHASNDEEAICNFRDGFDEKDLAGFRNIDRKFKYIAERGLVNANSSICWALDPAEFPDAYSDVYMYKLGRYWAARYGAYPVLWTIAQEIDKNMYKKYDTVTIKKWFAVAEAIDENDGYHHPLTAHMENTSHTRASDSWWGSKPYHSWWSIQWQGGINDDLFSVGKDFWNSANTKPSVLYESAYEGFWTDAKGAREAGYKAFQNGIYGYGYGANGVWNDLYSKNPPDYGTDYEMPVRFISWYDGANLQGAAQLAYLKKFYTSLQWWKLAPRFNDTAWSSLVDRNQCFISTDEQQTYVVYFANKVPSTGILNNLAKDAGYSAKWYDTRSGTYTIIGTVRTGTGKWTVPDKPDSDDWILLLIRL
jgi:Protein of unknown function (DUF4038)/Domain of unknown function (DUF5060)/Putative collagen-binding domain of a collagenase